MVDVDHGVEAALDEVSEQELHVPRFVAAERETGGVVALDEDPRHGAFVGIWVGIHRFCDCGAQSRGFFEWRAEPRQFDSRKFGDAVEDCLVVHLSALTLTLSRRAGEGTCGFLIWEPTAFSGAVVDRHDLAGTNARDGFQRVVADVYVSCTVDELPFAFMNAEEREIGVGAWSHATQHTFEAPIAFGTSHAEQGKR